MCEEEKRDCRASKEEGSGYPNACRNKANDARKYVDHSRHKTNKTKLLTVAVIITRLVGDEGAYKRIFFFKANKKSKCKKCSS